VIPLGRPANFFAARRFRKNKARHRMQPGDPHRHPVFHHEPARGRGYYGTARRSAAAASRANAELSQQRVGPRSRPGARMSTASSVRSSLCWPSPQSGELRHATGGGAGAQQAQPQRRKGGPQSAGGSHFPPGPDGANPTGGLSRQGGRPLASARRRSRILEVGRKAGQSSHLRCPIDSATQALRTIDLPPRDTASRLRRLRSDHRRRRSDCRNPTPTLARVPSFLVRIWSVTLDNSGGRCPRNHVRRKHVEGCQSRGKKLWGFGGGLNCAGVRGWSCGTKRFRASYDGNMSAPTRECPTVSFFDGLKPFAQRGHGIATYTAHLTGQRAHDLGHERSRGLQHTLRPATKSVLARNRLFSTRRGRMSGKRKQLT